MIPKVVTVKEIQSLDKLAIERIGIPSLVLMENAGRAVSEEILSEIRKHKKPKVCILCGLGNNAGDGFVVARCLANADIIAETFIVGKAACLKDDAFRNYAILKKLKIPVREINAVSKKFMRSISSSSMIVDAIFGVGLNRAIEEPIKSIIELVNSRKKYVVSVDIPSGLDGTTGKVHGVCIKASKTISFSFAKKGFFINDGPRYTGKVSVADVGIPKNLLKEIRCR